MIYTGAVSPSLSFIHLTLISQTVNQHDVCIAECVTNDQQSLMFHLHSLSLFHDAVTDVLDTHNWMLSSMKAHPLFDEMEITDELRRQDPCIAIMESQTEEGKKVLIDLIVLIVLIVLLLLASHPSFFSFVQTLRNGKQMYSTVFRRIKNSEISTLSSSFNQLESNKQKSINHYLLILFTLLIIHRS